MTKAELNQKLKEGIMQNATQEKTLPEDIADTFIKWVHALINNAQKKQEMKEHPATGEEEKAPEQPPAPEGAIA